MANPTEDLEIESPEVFGAHLLDAIENAPEGHLKRASDAGGKMIRRKLRESGITRLVIPHKNVTDEDLTYLPNTELPVIVEEMEPDSPGAKAIPFNDSADTAFYRADKFTIVFCKLTTPEFTKNVDELRTAGFLSKPVPKFLEISHVRNSDERCFPCPVVNRAPRAVAPHDSLAGS